MISNEVVEAKLRGPQVRGKNESRRVRVTGQIPAVVYGANKDAVSIILDPKLITRILYSESGHNTIFDLQLDGKKEKVMIVDWQYEPVKSTLLHIDLKRIAMDKALRVKVPVALTGESVGVKQQGGILEQVLREVEVECLPADIPSHIDVDVTELTFGQVIRVADLPHGGKLKFLTSEDQTVAHVISVKEVVTATPEVGAEVAAAAEPEVIKKGKQETEPAAAPAKTAAPAKK